MASSFLSSRTPLKAVVAVFSTCTLVNANADDQTQNKCTGPSHLKPECVQHAPSHATTMAAAEVQSLDPKANTVTLRFSRNRADSKTFVVQKPSMLASVREGDKVKFTTQNIDGKETITELQAQE